MRLVCQRYSRVQCMLGLFAAPTRIILGVAPVNAVLNYLLGMSPTLLVALASKNDHSLGT